ncbi:hypothetical protein LHJ74_16180 [Streptomyces sp. N2-109]|uniref:Uncharacterized protein n=1 Tax=Streptomyces gossypii TaxID=2883101 RepID=A0ABT2JVE5_9ACTN|nr:hypothetical protein [Streptomyces gossypii]MCT2591424.1 hypothetical protein [Streptomyces gossypii]
MKLTERQLTHPWEGVLTTPAVGTDVGVLVLATPEADALPGAAAWPHILDALDSGG